MEVITGFEKASTPWKRSKKPNLVQENGEQGAPSNARHLKKTKLPILPEETNRTCGIKKVATKMLGYILP